MKLGFLVMAWVILFHDLNANAPGELYAAFVLITATIITELLS